MFQSLNSFLSQQNESDTQPIADADIPNAPVAVSEDTQPSDENSAANEPLNVLDDVFQKYFGDTEPEDVFSFLTNEETESVEEETDDEDENVASLTAEDWDDAGSAQNFEDPVADDTDGSDLDGLWDALLDELSTDSASGGKTSERSGQGELDQIKQTLESLVSWQTAVQQYLQTSYEAENIRQVAQQLAGLGIILPDDQIQEIARLSQQLNIPPSVLLKAKAYDYTMQQIQQDERAPYPFMTAQRPSAPNILPNARPYQPPSQQPTEKATRFTGFREFLKQMGIPEE